MRPAYWVAVGILVARHPPLRDTWDSGDTILNSKEMGYGVRGDWPWVLVEVFERKIKATLDEISRST